MSLTSQGLTPRMRPLSSRKSATLSILDIGTSKVVCLIAELNPAEANERLPEYVLRLPFKPGTTPLRLLPHYEAWLYRAMTEADYGEYWKQVGYNVEEHYERHADVPVLHETGWHDSWTRSSIDLDGSR